jgi:hypothetical protein
MTYKSGSGSSDSGLPSGAGLRGADKQQDERPVQRTDKGHDDPARPAPVNTNNTPGRHHTTPREAVQSGADLRASTEVNDEGMPEGLRRERTHPLNPTTGRAIRTSSKRLVKD